MARRTVDGPKQRHLTTKQAAAYLDVSVPTFKRLVGVIKGSPLTLPGVTDWFRPLNIDGVTRWHWMDVVCLARILERRTDAAPLAAEEESDADQ